MSDHDAAPDPIDKAYAQAQSMLDDEAARAARRARVLAAVAADAEVAPPVAAPKRRVSRAAGAWLAAASVAGISALVAFQVATPVRHRAASPPKLQAPVAAAPAQPPAAAPATAPPSAIEAPAPAVPPPATPAARRAPVIPSADVADIAPPAAASAPAPAPPASEGGVEALIVTGQKREEDIQDVPFYAPSESPAAETARAAAPDTRTARLHAAAAAGRLAELRTLLAQGIAVDAPDTNGETALMKAIQAHQPAAAALLVGEGASLDRVNREGVSAREMAGSVDDPNLDRALGIEP